MRSSRPRAAVRCGTENPFLEPLAAALVVDKLLGIALAALFVVNAVVARLHGGVSMLAIADGGLLIGFGFTIALFNTSLGLEGASLAFVETGIVLGSAVSCALDFVLLAVALLKKRCGGRWGAAERERMN